MDTETRPKSQVFSSKTPLLPAQIRILIGLFRQIEWYAEGGWKVAEEKERQGLKIR